MRRRFGNHRRRVPRLRNRTPRGRSWTNVFYDLRPGWTQQVRAGDIIVAGRNFGVGSSRPVAALSRYLGIRTGSPQHTIEATSGRSGSHRQGRCPATDPVPSNTARQLYQNEPRRYRCGIGPGSGRDDLRVSAVAHRVFLDLRGEGHSVVVTNRPRAGTGMPNRLAVSTSLDELPNRMRVPSSASFGRAWRTLFIASSCIATVATAVRLISLRWARRRSSLTRCWPFAAEKIASVSNAERCMSTFSGRG